MSTELSGAVVEAIESVVSGWYADTARIDWADFLDRVEDMSGEDLGCDTMSPQIKAIKAYARKVRRELG